MTSRAHVSTPRRGVPTGLSIGNHCPFFTRPAGGTMFDADAPVTSRFLAVPMKNSSSVS